MILVTNTKTQCETLLATIEQRARAMFAAAGYTVSPTGDIVGKSAATQQDQPQAQRTTRWDVPHEAPDGRWYITSPRDSHPEQADDLLAGLTYTEIAMPEAWLPDESL